MSPLVDSLLEPLPHEDYWGPGVALNFTKLKGAQFGPRVVSVAGKGGDHTGVASSRQAFIDALADLAGGVGGVCLVPPGKWYIDQIDGSPGITVPPNVMLWGWDPATTTIVTPLDCTGFGAVFRTDHGNNAIHGITFKGNDTQSTGWWNFGWRCFNINAPGVDNSPMSFIVDNCDFINFFATMPSFGDGVTIDLRHVRFIGNPSPNMPNGSIGDPTLLLMDDVVFDYYGYGPYVTADHTTGLLTIKPDPLCPEVTGHYFYDTLAAGYSQLRGTTAPTGLMASTNNGYLPAHSFDIDGAVWDSDTHVITFHTPAPHYLSVGSKDVFVINMLPAGYTSVADVLSTPTSTSFTVAGPTSDPGSYVSGGQFFGAYSPTSFYPLSGNDVDATINAIPFSDDGSDDLRFMSFLWHAVYGRNHPGGRVIGHNVRCYHNKGIGQTLHPTWDQQYSDCFFDASCDNAIMPGGGICLISNCDVQCGVDAGWRSTDLASPALYQTAEGKTRIATSHFAGRVWYAGQSNGDFKVDALSIFDLPSEQPATSYPSQVIGVSPSGMSGLSQWFKADALAYSDAGSTLAGNGDSVYEWDDNVVGGPPLVEESGPTAPLYVTNVINGLPVIRCISKYLVCSSPPFVPTATAPFSVIAVGSVSGVGPTEVGDSTQFLSWGQAADATPYVTLGFSPNGVMGVAWVNDAGDETLCASQAVVAADEPWVVCMTYDGALIRLYLNGVAAGTAAPTGPITLDQMGIGCLVDGSGRDLVFHGDLEEVAIYEGMLNTAERQSQERYASQRCNIAVP